jgi:hypothetical protein
LCDDTAVKDAFNNTPLNDAVNAKHDLAASTLRQLGSREGEPPLSLTFPGHQAGVRLCEAAAAGELETVSVFAEPKYFVAFTSVTSLCTKA